ncbi:MAG TPA: hypothetical protein PK937_06020 [bacterium]|nr:hypothetical protein [bacterium]HNH32159.1 hypothetical protein [bacterium]
MVHFRNLLIIFVTIMAVMWTYMAMADGTATADRYITVDQDIWSFLKYVGVMFLGILSWAAVQLISSLKSLVSQVTDLNITVKVTQNEIMLIKEDVSEINSKIEKQDYRILQLEKAQKN